MSEAIIPFLVNNTINKRIKENLESFYYIKQFEDQNLEEAINKFLHSPGWSLIQENNINEEENNSIESHEKINFMVKVRRRGKKRSKYLFKENFHGRDSFDNLQRKIQVHFQTFLINFCNDALKTEPKVRHASFKQINYKNKTTVNFAYVSKLKKSFIKDLLNMEISEKYKTYNKYENQILLSKCKDSWLDRLFQMNYLELFRYYYNNGQLLKKIVFENREIVLSSKTKSFYYLIEKYKDLSQNIIDTVKSVYFDDDYYPGKYFSTKTIN